MEESPFNSYSSISGQNAKSFAHFTIKERLPAILDKLMMDHEAEPAVVTKLDALKRAILYGKIEHFPEEGHDVGEWSEYIAPHLGKTWFDAPFYFVEAYFYRMVLAATNYYENFRDPFFWQKQSELKNGRDKFDHLISAEERFSTLDQRAFIAELLQLNLWGNKADLSQLRTDQESHNNKNTLIDDSQRIIDILSIRISRLDIILDNSGMELFTDLLLAKWLLILGLVEKIVLHAKAFPTFVSDATESDVIMLLEYLRNQGPSDLVEFAESIRHFEQAGSLQITADSFWNAPLHFFEMPVDLYKELAHSDLIIFKGDANYRRIFGDRKIHPERLAEEFTKYLPAPAASVRILKSELMVGLTKEQVVDLDNEDSGWLVNGKYGVVQFFG